MKVRDKSLKKRVELPGKECLKYKCYQPRRVSHANGGKYLCGTQNAHGCPEKLEYREELLGPDLGPDFTTRSVGANGSTRHIFYTNNLDGHSLCGRRNADKEFVPFEVCEKCKLSYIVLMEKNNEE